MNDVVIVAAKRTAIGQFKGMFSSVDATELAATAIRGALSPLELSADLIEESYIGCVLPAGLGQAPARQAVLKAGLEKTTVATTVNKVCGSGLKAVMLAHDAIKLGHNQCVLAGGMENMTRSPFLLPNARTGLGFGHAEIKDHMLLDGLQDAYQDKAMGCFAQTTADKYQISREQMDEFALCSLNRAQQAQVAGGFNNEIEPYLLRSRKGDVLLDSDELPQKAKPEKIPKLRPAFADNGTITAANASAISDGAAALLLMSSEMAEQQNLSPIAKIIGHASFARSPEDFTLAPIGAIKKCLHQTEMQVEQIDCWEINEAFAMVTMLAIKELALDPERVNMHGGACALGHPIGASGARILVTLLNVLKQQQLKTGMASLCIGGGEGVALAVELC